MFLTIIPAKTISVRCPGKNWKPFAGKSLVQWAVDQADDADLKPLVIVDTRFRNAVRRAVTFTRPDNWPDDTWNMVSLFCRLQRVRRTVILLQPTSPLRTAAFIRKCIRLHRATRENVTSYNDGNPSGSVYIRNYGRWHDHGLTIKDPCPSDINTQEDFERMESLMTDRLGVFVGNP